MPKVLIISACHDEVTRRLHEYARAFIRGAKGRIEHHLFNEPAARIQHALSAHRKHPVFIFLHGRRVPPGVIDGLGKTVVEKKTAHLLASRVVCGTCYSLNGFADLVVSHGGTVIGYNGEMLVPLNRRRALQMKRAALAAHEALHTRADARRAADSARAEYRSLADRWFRSGTIEGQVHGALASLNSNSIGIKGTPTARI